MITELPSICDVMHLTEEEVKCIIYIWKNTRWQGDNKMSSRETKLSPLVWKGDNLLTGGGSDMYLR